MRSFAMFLIALVFALAFRVGFAAAATAPELPLQSHFALSTEPLRTESVWTLDPENRNPHRTRWVLTRRVEIAGLQAVKKKDGDYGARADSLFADAKAYLRAATDPSYSELQEFPCTKQPEDGFATHEGTQFAANRAGELWNELLGREVFKLSVQLRHVTGEFPENVTRNSNAVLGSWLSELERDWREKILPRVRTEEWNLYLKQAAKAGVCGARAKPRPPRVWSSMMEPPATESNPELIARAPAKRWGGLFSVLVTMRIGGQDLVGKFLIDSGAPESIISPTFLQNQGALSSWIEIPRAHPAKILWSGGSGVGTPAYVADVRVGGIEMPIHQFYIHETDFFGPPESFSTCCDGILGMDFLRQYAVEFRPGKTSEVNLYAREGFHPPHPIPWSEVSINARGEAVSSCIAEAKKPSREVINGTLKWDTGSEEVVEFNRAAAKTQKGLRWRLSCGTTQLSDNLQIGAKESGSTGTTALAAGIDLMARDQFFLDLGHGRIWFNPQGLLIPIVQNHSGLNLEFQFVDGERTLKVIGIRRDSPAESLRKAGLPIGATILSLDSKSVDEMDTWEVEQRLSAIYGDTVAVEWKTGKKSSKIAPLKLPAMAP